MPVPPLDIIMAAMLYGGLAATAVLGAVAAARRHAGWLVAASATLVLASIPLLFSGIGVVGIAVAVVLLGASRAMPGYAAARWAARAFALSGLGTVLTLQFLGARRGNAPSMVDWILLALAVTLCIVTFAPTRAPRGARPAGP